MNNENVIKIENYKQQFGKFVVLENINLDVKKGEILGLLGPSGSGKTTLIKSIVGMSEPTNGSVCVLDTKMPSLAVVSRIGYMAQSDALYEDLTALDNILFFASLYGLKGKFAKQRASEVLELVLLRDECKKLVKNFSGGMKRRLSLAIALVHKPELLILDEPTVGIDPVLRLQFWNEFERLRKEGVTIIITTHVMDEAEHCDRLALIRNGGLIAIGTPDELKEKSGESTVEGAFLYYGKERTVNHI
ncbi:ABC transporter ATP-binding protein [Clostridium estertheticum]|uniref:ABC transporter ATP-binding protein n=1 Tax=Clostridium estertheticum TaxID=238834 RepID=UPI001C0B2AA0|nr:ABC transporter ATP-binding protein [Clostridium estertheticum]MBU3184987.1 ABC transporter ATP-binding protein [Clostridium estertheticum]